jgi:signal transduction histidine kinase
VLEERERLARELHAEAATRALAEPATSNLADIRETVREALAEMRLLLFERRPPPRRRWTRTAFPPA